MDSNTFCIEGHINFVLLGLAIVLCPFYQIKLFIFKIEIVICFKLMCECWYAQAVASSVREVRAGHGGGWWLTTAELLLWLSISYDLTFLIIIFTFV